LRALSKNQRFVVAAVAAALGLGLHQWMPLVVGAITLARAFESSAHPEGDRGALTTFIAALVLLAALATIPMTKTPWS
jgi:hypothetical protein